MSLSSRTLDTHTVAADLRAAVARVLTTSPFALPGDLAARTELLGPTLPAWWDRILQAIGCKESARRCLDLRRGWRLFRESRRFDVVISTGDLAGGTFAALSRFQGRRRPVHVMYDCLCYGAGGPLRRAWTRFYLRQVDRCIVWASVERERYAQAYGVSLEKFHFIPHHDTLHARYAYELGDDGYIFADGDADCDFGLLFAALRGIGVPCVLATNRPTLLVGLHVPSNVRVLGASAAEFLKLMAKARLVVMPMRPTLFHSGAHQSIINAMMMGKPVILTDPKCGADYIRNRGTGLLVPFGDVFALHSAIEYLLIHPAESRAMGENARAEASQLTTERCYVAMWSHALQILCEQRSAGRGGSQSRRGQQRWPYIGR